MNPNLTEIVYVLDRSGSMSPLCEAAISGFNRFLAEQRGAPGTANLSLLLFDNEFLTPARRQPVASVAELDASTYVPRGSTALFDAIGLAIETLTADLATLPGDQVPAKVIVAVFTDGMENASTRFSSKHIQSLIQNQRTHAGWEFLFLAADESALQAASDLGFADRDIAGVPQDPRGMETAASSFSRKIRSFREHLDSGIPSPDLERSMLDIVEDEEKFGRN